MSAVTITIAQQIISQPNINNIVFAQGAQILLALYIKSFDFIENIGFCQSFDIRLNRLYSRLCFSGSIFQKSLID